MTDLDDMIQPGAESNTSDASTTEAYLSALEEFKSYYEKFVGYPVDDLMFGQEAQELYARYGKQPVWSHPLARTALVGAGSLAATLVVGFALSHNANNRPNPNLEPPSTQSQPNSGDRTPKTSSTSQITAPTSAGVEFSNSHGRISESPVLSASAIPPRVRAPLQMPLPLQAIGQPEMSQLQSPQLRRVSPGVLPTQTAPMQTSQNAIGSYSQAVLPEAALVQPAGPSQANPEATVAQPASVRNAAQAISEAGGTLPFSQLTPTLPPWVNSNVAPETTTQPTPDHSQSLLARASAPIESAASIAERNELSALYSSATQMMVDGRWRIDSSIAFRSYGMAEPEAALPQEIALEGQ